MNYFALLISLVALAFSYQAYEHTAELKSLKPLAEMVRDTQAKVEGARNSTKAIREKAAVFLHELAEEIKQ